MFVSILEKVIDEFERIMLYFAEADSAVKAKANEIKSRNKIGTIIPQYVELLPKKDPKSHEVKNNILHGVLYPKIEIIKQDINARYICFRYKKPSEINYQSMEKQMQDYYQAIELSKVNFDYALIMLIMQFERYIIEILNELNLNCSRVNHHSPLIENSEDGINKVLSWLRTLEMVGVSLDIGEENIETLKKIYLQKKLIVYKNISFENSSAAKKGDNNDRCKLGEELHVDVNSILHGYNCIAIIIYKIAIGVMEFSEDYVQESNRLFNLGYRHLARNEWQITRLIFNFLRDNDRVIPSTKIISRINYWISVLHLDGFEAIENEVKEYKFSVEDPVYAMAQLVILHEYDEAIIILESLFGSRIHANEIETWPLFKGFRGSEQYFSFKNKHAAEFEINEYWHRDVNDRGL